MVGEVTSGGLKLSVQLESYIRGSEKQVENFVPVPRFGDRAVS